MTILAGCSLWLSALTHIVPPRPSLARLISIVLPWDNFRESARKGSSERGFSNPFVSWFVSVISIFFVSRH